MAINQLSTANSFSEWLTTTGYLVNATNALTDNVGGSGFLANTSLFIQGTDASLNVRTLANINTLQANTGNIANVFFAGSNIYVPKNITVNGNITRANITSNLSVGGDAFISGNLVVSGNLTLDTIGFQDLLVSGSANVVNTLFVSSNSTFVNAVSAQHISLTGSFTGPPNTAIYQAIATVDAGAIAYAIALG
jgi:cytoskeletal protein CcmA (bactofilin family)